MTTAPVWVKASYLYLVCLIANLIMIYGAVTFARGAVTTALPRTDVNPITSIANAIADVVQDTVAPFAADLPPEVAKGLSTVRSAIDKQARNRGIGTMVTGFIIFGVGMGAFLVAYRQANPSRREPAPAPTYQQYTVGQAPPAQASAGQPPYGQYQPPYTPPGQPPSQ